MSSPSDSLKEQKLRCEKWIEGGVQEAVLLHPETKTAIVYLSNGSVEEIPNEQSVVSKVLEGIVIDCSAIWEEL